MYLRVLRSAPEFIEVGGEAVSWIEVEIEAGDERFIVALMPAVMARSLGAIARRLWI